MKIPNFSVKGTKLEEVSFPANFSVKKNLSLLAQAIHVYEERSHVGLADTKTRSEINKTRKKWYKQKGTGGARHGAKSAPIFVGGGVAHGPKPIRRILSLPKKMVKIALYQALAVKINEKRAIAVSGIGKAVKTHEIAAFLKKVGTGKKFTFILSAENMKVKKYLRNIENLTVVAFKDLNALNIFKGGMLIFDADIFAKEKTVKTAVKTAKKKKGK